MTNFLLSFFDLNTGIMWFVIGVSGVAILSLMIDSNKILQYLGRMSLVILCIHGPVYRIMVKLLSISLHMNTDGVRGNFVLVMLVVAVTAVICAAVYEVVLRIAPWMIGKRNK